MNTIKLGFTIKASKKDREYFDSEIGHFYEMVDENKGNLSSIDLEKRYMEFLIDVMEGKALTKEYGVDVIKEFIGDLDGNLVGLKTVDVEWILQDGERPRLQELEGTEKEWDCELALLALGFTGSEKTLADAFGLKFDFRKEN